MCVCDWQGWPECECTMCGGGREGREGEREGGREEKEKVRGDGGYVDGYR